MAKTLNIILGNAPINNGNRGCVALSYTSIYLIDKVLSEAGIQYELYVPDYGHEQVGTYNIDVAGKDISYNAIKHIIGYGPKSGLKTFIKRLINYQNISSSINIYNSADYILDIGQGDSFADIYGKERFEGINLIHREALMLHKPYCLLPQTIGPFKDDTIRAEAVKAAKL